MWKLKNKKRNTSKSCYFVLFCNCVSVKWQDMFSEFRQWYVWWSLVLWEENHKQKAESFKPTWEPKQWVGEKNKRCQTNPTETVTVKVLQVQQMPLPPLRHSLENRKAAEDEREKNNKRCTSASPRHSRWPFNRLLSAYWLNISVSCWFPLVADPGTVSAQPH